MLKIDYECACDVSNHDTTISMPIRVITSLSCYIRRQFEWSVKRCNDLHTSLPGKVVKKDLWQMSQTNSEYLSQYSAHLNQYWNLQWSPTIYTYWEIFDILSSPFKPDWNCEYKVCSKMQDIERNMWIQKLFFEYHICAYIMNI